MTTVDQQKIRRTRTGLIAHDPTRAAPGYTLFAPMFGDGTVYLVDMAGAGAHTWAVMEVDWRGRVVWELRHPDHHHDARRSGTATCSSSACAPCPLEIDPRTGGTVWEYTDPSLFEFFSPYISGAQRLANGNTLVCEGCHGRTFEVTRDREVVWEYVSPHFSEEPGAPGLNNRVLRAFRLPAEIEAARRT